MRSIGSGIAQFFLYAGEKPPIVLSVIGDEYWEDNHLAGPPTVLQKLLLKMVAPIGRLRGYRSSYPEYSPPERAAE